MELHTVTPLTIQEEKVGKGTSDVHFLRVPIDTPHSNRCENYTEQLIRDVYCRHNDGSFRKYRGHVEALLFSHTNLP